MMQCAIGHEGKLFTLEIEIHNWAFERIVESARPRPED